MSRNRVPLAPIPEPAVPVLAELSIARDAVIRISGTAHDLHEYIASVERALAGGMPERVRRQAAKPKPPEPRPPDNGLLIASLLAMMDQLADLTVRLGQLERTVRFLPGQRHEQAQARPEPHKDRGGPGGAPRARAPTPSA